MSKNNDYFYVLLMLLAAIGGQDVAKMALTVLVADLLVSKCCKTRIQAAFVLVTTLIVVIMRIWR